MHSFLNSNHDHSGGGPSDDASLQFSVMKYGFGDNMSVGTNDSSIGQHSALASFSPYYIDDKNVEIMNQLFENDDMWKDINTEQADMHKLGAALDQESVDGYDSSSSVKTGHSSLTDFWDAMNKRYNYPSGRPGPGSRHGGRPRTTDHAPSVAPSESITRSRLNEAAVVDRRVAMSQTHGPVGLGRGDLRSPSGHASPYSKKPSSRSKPFRLTPDAALSARRPPDAIVPDSLARLDPLSLNVSTALRTYVQEQRKRAEGIPVGGDDVSILIDAREEDQDENSSKGNKVMPTEVDETDGLGHDQDVSNTYFVSRVKSTASNRTRIRAEKLRDMKFLQNFFLGKATMGDTQELISKMQV